MSDTIYQELLIARNRIQYQIDVLLTPSIVGLGYRPDKKATIDMLRAKLREIDEAISDLKAGE